MATATIICTGCAALRANGDVWESDGVNLYCPECMAFFADVQDAEHQEQMHQMERCELERLAMGHHFEGHPHG